jgi:RNA polymerase primary sigma factor
VAQQLAANPTRGWAAFEHFFKRDIDRIIGRRFPDAVDSGRQEDIYHDLVADLIADDCRRIRAYDGQGSFGGFVLRIVNNLCIDLLRKEMPRRRLPAAIKRLPALEQEVFRQLYWENCPPERLAGALHARSVAHDGPDAIKAAAAKVRAALPPNFQAPGEGDDGRPKLVALSSDAEEGHAELPDDRPTPEAGAIAREEEEALEQASDALRTAIAGLAPEARLYLQYVMAEDPAPAPREIARLMGRPVTEIYRLRQQAERQLRQTLSENAAVKNRRMSV